MLRLNQYSKRHLKDNIDYVLFLIPPFAIYFIFFIVPNIQAVFYSLFKWDGLSDQKVFVGLNNFIRLFTMEKDFLLALKNTLIYTFTLIFGQNTLALFIAFLIYKKGWINNIYRTMYYLPMMFSTVTIGFIWGFMYDPSIGVINTALKTIGLDFLARSWLSDKSVALLSIVVVHIWWGLGQGIVLFIAGLQGIPAELYESGNIDGCNAWQGFWNITFPMLLPVTAVVTVLTTIGGFKSFDLVFVMTAGGSDNSTLVLAMQLFKEGFMFSNMGYASAIAVILLVIVSIISYLQMVLLKERT